MVVLVLFSATAVAAVGEHAALSGHGSGVLTRDAHAQKGGSYELRGYLQPNGAPSTSAIVQDGERFTIMAKAVATSQVCYNDTIFRDDFDNDGG